MPVVRNRQYKSSQLLRYAASPMVESSFLARFSNCGQHKHKQLAHRQITNYFS